jgi:pimeloyl-ACP methyl ester carboxylesterase
MKKYLRLFSLLIFTISISAQAGQTLVLVHGYLADGSLWRPSGIVGALQQGGWQDAGHLFPNGTLPGWTAPSLTGRYLYTVTLPSSEAPLMVQTQWLSQYLHFLQAKHPDNSLILVGHSAGGVVARLSMIHSGLAVKGLITISSPHLGTDKAEWAVLASNSPFSWFAPFFGMDTINRSEGLYWDLIRETPSTALFWFNRQPHPQARYISVVRVGKAIGVGDDLVPAYSQDMNHVPALAGRAITVTSIGTHSLQPSDGYLLVSLLKSLF